MSWVERDEAIKGGGLMRSGNSQSRIIGLDEGGKTSEGGRAGGGGGQKSGGGIIQKGGQ